MNSYRRRLQLAVERTEKWKLACLSSILMKTWANHGEENGFTLNHQQEYWARFSRQIPQPPEVRAISCAPVHFGAQTQLMMMRYEWAPVITIGDVYIDGQACFDVKRNSLRRYLRVGTKASGPIHIHVWLTFADLTVYDLTIIPWLLRQRGESMDLDRSDGLAILGEPDVISPNLEYRPVLIGPEFLWKTGTLDPDSKHMFQAVEKKWAMLNLERIENRSNVSP